MDLRKCRTCFSDLQPNDLYQKLNAMHNNSTLSLADKLKVCVPAMSLQDVSNLYICMQCSMNLETAFTFRSTCLEAEDKFKEYFAESSGSNNMLKSSKQKRSRSLKGAGDFCHKCELNFRTRTIFDLHMKVMHPKEEEGSFEVVEDDGKTAGFKRVNVKKHNKPLIETVLVHMNTETLQITKESGKMSQHTPECVTKRKRTASPMIEYDTASNDMLVCLTEKAIEKKNNQAKQQSNLYNIVDTEVEEKGKKKSSNKEDSKVKELTQCKTKIVYEGLELDLDDNTKGRFETVWEPQVKKSLRCKTKPIYEEPDWDLDEKMMEIFENVEKSKVTRSLRCKTKPIYEEPELEFEGKKQKRSVNPEESVIKKSKRTKTKPIYKETEWEFDDKSKRKSVNKEEPKVKKLPQPKTKLECKEVELEVVKKTKNGPENAEELKAKKFLRCFVCKKKFEKGQESSLMKHVAAAHKSKCRRCMLCYRHYTNMKVHRRTFGCQMQNVSKKKNTDMLNITQANNNGNIIYYINTEHNLFMCIICRRKCSKVSELEQHILNKHDNGTLCKLCSKQFVGLSYCAHIGRGCDKLMWGFRFRETPNGECICPICEESVPDKNALRAHLSCHSENEFECTTCGKTYALVTSYIKHKLQCRQKTVNTTIESVTMSETSMSPESPGPSSSVLKLDPLVEVYASSSIDMSPIKTVKIEVTELSNQCVDDYPSCGESDEMLVSQSNQEDFSDTDGKIECKPDFVAVLPNSVFE